MDNRNHAFLNHPLSPLLLLAVLLIPASLQAADSFGERLRGLFRDDSPAAAAEEAILPVDEAFRFNAVAEGPDRLNLLWQIADGYYLYRDRFHFRIVRGDAGIDAQAVDLPPGHIKEDEAFGRVEVNTGELQVALPLQRDDRGHRQDIVLEVAYQGCKEDSVCYPPVHKQVSLTLDAAAGR